MSVIRFCIMALSGLLLVAQPAFAQDTERQLKVVEHIWGFDGRVQPGQFNPLSILLDNQTDEPIDAMASLQQVQGLLRPTGGQYVQQIFVAPTTRRWIQFYPYIASSQTSDWRLTVGDKKLQDFTQPRAAVKVGTDEEDPPPQVVILDRASQLSLLPSTVKHLPENIFPPYATVTTGLHTVFLDHVPDWEQPRQQAFLSWLKRGGRLHLLKDQRSEYPQFSGVLSDINQPFDRYEVGDGLVIRHAAQRSDVTEIMVRGAAVVDELQNPDEEAVAQAIAAGQVTGNTFDVFEAEPSVTDDTVFRRMRELTLPDHAWWLIFLLAFCYIGLIFPGCFAISKQKQLHFLTTYGAIAGLSLIFSMLFLFIGRRGYGETTTLQTLAVARHEEGGIWNVLEWNALFVTSGDTYLASADDQQAVITTAETINSTDAMITSGQAASIAMRIPPFSSQTFMDRRQVTEDSWKLEVTDFEATGSGLIRLRIKCGEAYPASKDARHYVLFGRRIHTMHYDAEKQELELLGAASSVAAFCGSTFVGNTTAPGLLSPANSNEQTKQKQFFQDALPMLVRRSLVDDLVPSPARFELPADRVRLLVYAPIPGSFDLTVSADTERTGRVLYVRNLRLPGR